MYEVIRPLLFRFDPEFAHDLTLNLLSFVGHVSLLRNTVTRFFKIENPALQVQAFGLSFPNPVGLAAGYDKDGVAAAGLDALGFGHIELGTVTPRGQTGNPKPRIFRLPEDGALINRMGFPNAGADALLKRLRRRRPANAVFGINIGKGVDTPLERAAEDYRDMLLDDYTKPGAPGEGLPLTLFKGQIPLKPPQVTDSGVNDSEQRKEIEMLISNLKQIQGKTQQQTQDALLEGFTPGSAPGVGERGPSAGDIYQEFLNLMEYRVSDDFDALSDTKQKELDARYYELLQDPNVKRQHGGSTGVMRYEDIVQQVTEFGKRLSSMEALQNNPLKYGGV